MTRRPTPILKFFSGYLLIALLTAVGQEQTARAAEDPVHAAFAREYVTWQHINADDHLSPLKTDRPAIQGGAPYWGRIAKLGPVERALVLMEELYERMAAAGVDVSAERRELAELRRRQRAIAAGDAKAESALYFDARYAKRRLLLRDPQLAPLAKLVFVKRHPYLCSHNYSDILDSQFLSGGSVCTLTIPSRDGRLDPSQAKTVTIFNGSAGIVRDAMLDFDAGKVFFAFRPERAGVAGYPHYWHLMVVNIDGSGLRQLSDGPYHDMYPCPLPDGGLAFMSTRCQKRFLCWRPQAYVLYRLDDFAAGKKSTMRPLSYANLTEWTPTVMGDGRILWTRSEYLDKGANFGHTLWAIHPDGTQPTLVYGNNTPNCYVNAREVPGTQELLCTLFSHGGDHNGPLGLIDLTKRPFDPTAITNITPDSRPYYDMDWPTKDCFRDPTPISRDYFLASYAPGDRFGLSVVDRYGNREWLHSDATFGCMTPSLLRATPRPPVLPRLETADKHAPGQFSLMDVYQGLPSVSRGRVKYLRVCEEVASQLPRLANGEYCQDCGEDFQDYYASPTHLVEGPNGWPTFVAKTSLGLVPVEADGSASFSAPSGKVLYFVALDGELNEIQRMRSVVQLQPGEQRGCVGCHEDRKAAPPPKMLPTAFRREVREIAPSPWGTEPFSYEKVVQPVWDAKCVSCHGASDKKMNLAGTLDARRVPASYQTLISGGWVNYFSLDWGRRHYRAEPMSFGTLKSKLWTVLNANHYGVQLTPGERERIKCWIDLNCPLWPDYAHRPERPGPKPPLAKTTP